MTLSIIPSKMERGGEKLGKMIEYLIIATQKINFLLQVLLRKERKKIYNVPTIVL